MLITGPDYYGPPQYLPYEYWQRQGVGLRYQAPATTGVHVKSAHPCPEIYKER